VLLTQLASQALESSRKACGEYDELTRELNSLHLLLRRIVDEVSKPESVLHTVGDDRVDEL
jgi:hypothetical protein